MQPPPSSREIQSMNSVLGSSEISLHDLPATSDDFFHQMMFSAALPPWPDLAPANASGPIGSPAEPAPSKHEASGVGFHHFDEPAAILASRLRNHQIGNGGSKAAMMGPQHQMLLVPHDVADGSAQGGVLGGGGSVQSLYDGFAGSLHASGQAPNPTQLFHPPQGGATQAAPPNFAAQAAASGSAAGGPAPAQPKQQRVRARRGQATDPHSIAERVRRERIAERMRALQELVPSASKTDKSSMLDEIIDYVKFLQLQVKVLSVSRLGGSAVVAPLVADMSPVSERGGGNCVQAGARGNGSAGGDQAAATDDDSLTAAEHQVANLMDKDMGSAMQYLQGKGLCLMPISLANTISTTTSRGSRNAAVGHIPALAPNGEGPASPSMSVLTVQSVTLGNGPGLDGGSASVSKP